MPVIKHFELEEKGEIGVWRMEEDADWYLQRVDLSVEESQQLKEGYQPKRQEWLAVRYLLHLMSGRKVRGKVLKDAFGKPYLEKSDWQISISHSKEMAAVMASPRDCGIDIQKISKKIIRIAPRFMHKSELSDLNGDTTAEKIHVYWGAKESLYKLYGKNGLDFRADMQIADFKLRENGKIQGWTTGQIKGKDGLITSRINFKRLGEYILVYTQLDA